MEDERLCKCAISGSSATSMIEGYSTKEVVECCQEYLKVQKGIGKPDSRHKGRLAGKGTSGRKVFIDHDYKEVSRAHYSVYR